LQFVDRACTYKREGEGEEEGRRERWARRASRVIQTLMDLDRTSSRV
jgi:hypothetical protein